MHTKFSREVLHTIFKPQGPCQFMHKIESMQDHKLQISFMNIKYPELKARDHPSSWCPPAGPPRVARGRRGEALHTKCRKEVLHTIFKPQGPCQVQMIEFMQALKLQTSTASTKYNQEEPRMVNHQFLSTRCKTEPPISKCHKVLLYTPCKTQGTHQELYTSCKTQGTYVQRGSASFL